jgi:hypothetical protein
VKIGVYMKKSNFMCVLICGLMTLALETNHLAADGWSTKDILEKMSIDEKKARHSHGHCESHKNESNKSHQRGPAGENGSIGATGPTGPTGAPGSPITPSYISYYSSATQTIPSGTSAFLAFVAPQTTNDTITPSPSGSAPANTVDTFTVTIPGIYLISWNVAITTGMNINAALDLIINGSAINSPFEQQSNGIPFDGSILTCPVSGSFLVNVNAAQTIQLQVSGSGGDNVTATAPSISILRVADIP